MNLYILYTINTSVTTLHIYIHTHTVDIKNKC